MSGNISAVEQRVVLKTREMQLLEAAHGRPIQELLRSLYEDDGLTVEAIAERLQLTKGTVSRWMERFGIRARRPGTAHREAVA